MPDSSLLFTVFFYSLEIAPLIPSNDSINSVIPANVLVSYTFPFMSLALILSRSCFFCVIDSMFHRENEAHHIAHYVSVSYLSQGGCQYCPAF